MYTSLLYKEWIKSRRAIWLLLAVFAGVGAYLLLATAKQYQADATAYWEFIVQNSDIQTGRMKYLPLAAGILLAIVQLTPEMHNRRLKLTLHLPLDESKTLCTILGFGMTTLAVLFTVTVAALLAGLRVYLSPEMVFADFISLLPWMLGGMAAYLTAAWICLEPVWKQRILNLLPGTCWVSFFYTGALPGAYVPFLPWLVALIVAGFFFPFYSTARFKHGVQ
ncbi:MAG: hypothetical protein LBS03_01685 [Bacteroidales bacterium]|jgi:hypothetical protein|nr:hypothetical protein [Bacteroidales bacterium]